MNLVNLMNRITLVNWIAVRNINNIRYADDTTLMVKSEEELKSLLMTVKKESEKAGLKLNIQKTKIMASGPVTSWQIDGENVEAVAYFMFLSSKIIVDGNCNHEIKSYDKPRHPIKKQRHHITDKVPHKAMVFPVVMNGWESWTTKKAEHGRTDAFKLWCWRRLLSIPWAARRSNQSILKEINPEDSLEGLVLKLQYFGHLMQRPTQ